MNKQKRFLIILLIFLVFMLSSCKIYATNIVDGVKTAEMSNAYQKYLKLSDEKKKSVVVPKMYDIQKSERKISNPLKLAKMLGATIESSYSLKSIIPENMVVKNQKQTYSSWTFASLGMLESTLAVMNYKNNKTPITYDLSESHMEYATSREFLDGINEKGFNRTVGEGGDYYLSIPYLTNGTGAIDESEMPFIDTEEKIELSKIQNKNILTQVNDIIQFPSYSLEDDKTLIKQQIKEHIKNYGAVYAGVYGIYYTSTECYNNNTGALYCDNDIDYPIDQNVIIIGWDDNYSKANFIEDKQPANNGAWIIKNSLGVEERKTLLEMKEIIFSIATDECTEYGWTSAELITDEFAKEFFKDSGYTIENNEAVQKIGDNGFMYVSYEDANIYTNLYGITDAQDKVEYDNIYQYDQYGGVAPIEVDNSKAYLLNIFDKKTKGTEYLTQVSIMTSEKYTCKVYVNPNGTSKEKSDLKQVQLKSGETETFEAGYHTIEFLNAIEITGNQFVVMIEIQGEQAEKIGIMAEYNYCEFNNIGNDVEAIAHIWDYVNIENEKCFIASEDDYKLNKWLDTSTAKNESDGKIPNFNTTLKAFTTSKKAESTLENIEITKEPTKTNYIEDENFDATGMVVKANYSDNSSKEITDYTISNGTSLKLGQTSVTIEYKGKIVTQLITVTQKEEVKKPQNTNFDTANAKVAKMQSYYFTDVTKNEYSILTVDINNIILANGNEKMEYYYYLSSSSKENNIKNWVKAQDLDENDNKLTFKINTLELSNYEELTDAESIYIYIKEIATLNNIKQEKITSAIELKINNLTIEEFIDGNKKTDIKQDEIENPTPDVDKDSDLDNDIDFNEEENDKTLAPDTFPKAGKNIILIGLIFILAFLGRIAYLKYKKIQIR